MCLHIFICGYLQIALLIATLLRQVRKMCAICNKYSVMLVLGS